MSATVTKHISFPAPLFAFIEKQAGKFGLSIAEYMRHLALMEIREQEFEQKISRKNWENSLPEYEISEKYWNILDEGKKEMVEMTLDEFKQR